MKCHLGQQLYRGPGLRFTDQIWRTSYKRKGRTHWLDLATVGVAAQLLRWVIAKGWHTRYKAGMLAIAVRLEFMAESREVSIKR